MFHLQLVNSNVGSEVTLASRARVQGFTDSNARLDLGSEAAKQNLMSPAKGLVKV